MPYQCVHCSRIIPSGSKELLEGCENCGNHFFFYIKEEQIKKIKENPLEISEEDKKTIEKDIRKISGIVNEESPVILDIESIRAIKPGKFEIDLVNLFKKNRPLIYKISEGKYVIDLTTTLNKETKKLEKKGL
jgi:predicted  nucleic acid-binding Zn-ribbon protein